jgi:hypothetical protein
LKEQLDTVTKDRDQFRSAEADRVKKEFEELPEDVRAVATFDISKINEGSTYTQVVEQLPKLKALADKLSGKPAGSKPQGTTPDKKDIPLGNKPDPKIVSKSATEVDKATEKSILAIRRSF